MNTYIDASRNTNRKDFQVLSNTKYLKPRLANSVLEMFENIDLVNANNTQLMILN